MAESIDVQVVRIDPARRVAELSDGATVSYDLLIGVPVHRAPDVVQRPLAANGWVQVDQTNLTTRFPGVYALGDVATGARMVARAGVFAEAAARVVADDSAGSERRALGGRGPAPSLRTPSRRSLVALTLHARTIGWPSAGEWS